MLVSRHCGAQLQVERKDDPRANLYFSADHRSVSHHHCRTWGCGILLMCALCEGRVCRYTWHMVWMCLQALLHLLLDVPRYAFLVLSRKVAILRRVLPVGCSCGGVEPWRNDTSRTSAGSCTPDGHLKFWFWDEFVIVVLAIFTVDFVCSIYRSMQHVPQRTLNHVASKAFAVPPQPFRDPDMMISQSHSLQQMCAWSSVVLSCAYPERAFLPPRPPPTPQWSVL